MLMKEIRTERLLIKTPEIDDKFELTQLINDKHVIKWLSDMPFPYTCLLYTSPSPRDVEESRMPSSA